MEYLDEPLDPEDGVGPGVRVVTFPGNQTLSRFNVDGLAWGPEVLTLSPDGQMVAIGSRDGPPLLFRTATGERVVIGGRHFGRLESLAFSADGKVLESFADDGQVVRWETSTLTPLGREAAPLGRRKPRRNRNAAPKRELTENGRESFEFPEMRWDAKSAEVRRIDAKTGHVSENKIPLPWYPGSSEDELSGLVPGGKYFHIGTQIYDRQTFKIVAARRFGHVTFWSMAFSPDGSRFAASVSKSVLHVRHGRIESDFALVGVQETLSGKTVAAFTPQTDRAYGLTFSPDGTQLAWINTDGTIELRQLP